MQGVLDGTQELNESLGRTGGQHGPHDRRDARLADDVALFEEEAPELLDELRDVACSEHADD